MRKIVLLLLFINYTLLMVESPSDTGTLDMGPSDMNPSNLNSSVEPSGTTDP